MCNRSSRANYLWDSKDEESQLVAGVQMDVGSLYGGIISANLSTKELSLELSETAVKELGLEHSPAILAIKLSLSSDEVEELTYALTEVVFKDDNNFSIEK